MHVLYVPSWYPSSWHPNAGVFFLEQAEAMRRAGLRVGVVYPEFRSLRQLGWRELGENYFQTQGGAGVGGLPELRFRGWSLTRSSWNAALWVKAAQRLAKRYVREHGVPDLIHAHGLRWGGVAAQRIAEMLGRPYVVTEHASAYLTDDLHRFERTKIKGAMERAAMVFAVSSSLRDALVRYGNPTELEVLPNFIDVDYFSPPIPSERGKGGLRLLTVAQLLPIKGVDLLLRSFARARQRLAVPSLSLVSDGEGGELPSRAAPRLEIAGKGPERPALEALAEQLGIADDVHFLGEIDRESIREAYWRADALVSTSRFETFGVAIIEAMATGLPVLATRCGGPQDTVVPSVGRLLAVDDVGGMAEAIVDLGRNYGAWAERRSAIRERCRERFGNEAVTRRLLEFYTRVVGLPPLLKVAS